MGSWCHPGFSWAMVGKGKFRISRKQVKNQHLPLPEQASFSSLLWLLGVRDSPRERGTRGRKLRHSRDSQLKIQGFSQGAKAGALL